MFLVLSLHKVYKAHEVNTYRTVSTGSPRLTSALKSDLWMQSRNLLHLLDGDALYFGFVQLFICGTTKYLLFKHDIQEIILKAVMW